MEARFPIPPSQKKLTLQAEELARARRERAAPAGLASWRTSAARGKICRFCSALHGGAPGFFPGKTLQKAKGKMTEGKKINKRTQEI